MYLQENIFKSMSFSESVTKEYHTLRWLNKLSGMQRYDLFLPCLNALQVLFTGITSFHEHPDLVLY